MNFLIKYFKNRALKILKNNFVNVLKEAFFGHVKIICGLSENKKIDQKVEFGLPLKSENEFSQVFVKKFARLIF